MLVDAHNHIWDVPWPPIGPDVMAGNTSRFLHQMDENGVQYAIVVCHLDEHDPNNNANALARAKEFPDRFRIWVNVHLYKPDALDRVNEFAGADGLVGVSYYKPFSPEDEGAWMQPGPLFDRIAELGLSVNLALAPMDQPKLRTLAAAYPSIPFFVCHLGGPARNGQPVAEWEEVLRSAEVENIHIKISGFAYSTLHTWEYPYPDVLPYIERIYRAFGAGRMLWGSDYPPTMRYMTYRQSVEVIRTHCTFMPDADRAQVLGGTAARVFKLDH